MASLLARPPTASARASTRIDLPAPVSPVSAVKPDPNSSLINVKVKVDTFIVYNEGNEDSLIQESELRSRLSDKLEKMKAGVEKVVFVDFEDGVPWATAVKTMDTIRSLATDANHDDVKVALKVREEPKPQ